MKSIKFLVIIAGIILGFTNTTYAQIAASSTRVFYTNMGSSEGCLEYCVKFEDGKLWLKSVRYDRVRNNLAKTSSYYDNQRWTDSGNFCTESYEQDVQARVFIYVAALSTPSRKVYKRHVKYSSYFEEACSQGTPFGVVDVQVHPTPFARLFPPVTYFFNYYQYVAFSPDKSSFIYWEEKSNNIDGNIANTREYSIVSKEMLLPKSVNYDFLNE